MNTTMNLRIIKRIAKQGKNRLLVIPKDLHAYLQAGDLVELQIRKMQEVKPVEGPKK